MTAATGRAEGTPREAGDSLGAWVQRNAWTLGLLALLVALLVVTKLIQPRYGAAGIQGLAISVLPLALAAAAQACAVIAGGIDLSVGSMLALANVVSAVLMKDQGPEMGIAVFLGVLVLGMVVGAVNGAVVVATRVPDIVVTLAMAFVWGGLALLILPTPGGGAVEWLKDITLGSVLSEWIPKAAIVLVVVVAAIWLPLRRSTIGLSLYAIGSNSLAAYRSGVSVGRTKIVAYSLTGLFSALAGLSLTASTGIGTPLATAYTLQSVAAIVLGGVSLAGGRGGLFGPIVAVLVLQLIRTDMTLLRVNTSLATTAQGVILIAVVMVGTFIQLRRDRA